MLRARAQCVHNTVRVRVCGAARASTRIRLRVPASSCWYRHARSRPTPLRAMSARATARAVGPRCERSELSVGTIILASGASSSAPTCKEKERKREKASTFQKKSAARAGQVNVLTLCYAQHHVCIKTHIHRSTEKMRRIAAFVLGRTLCRISLSIAGHHTTTI